MGLRINTNLPSLIALRNLNLTDVSIQKTFQRLSTGERINSAKDDPFGLSLSETLRSQVRGLQQASDNTENAGNLASVAEDALGQITDILHEIRSSIIFSLDGTASPDQLAAEQDFVDSAVSAIRRIAQTTRFGDIPLLNGQASFQIENVSASGIVEVRPERVAFNPIVNPTPFTFDVTASATQATLTPGAVAGGDILIRVDGPNGTSTVNLAGGTTAAEVVAAIDSLRGFTGVFGSGSSIYTEGFGSNVNLRIEVIDGTGTLGGSPVGTVLFDQGSDAAGNFQGTAVGGIGRVLSIQNSFFTGEIELHPGALGTFGFEVRRSGLLFQLGDRTTAANQETIGIANMAPESLGKSAINIGGQTLGGFLSTLVSGEANDMVTDPDNALRILDDTLKEVGRARSSLGSFISSVVEPAGRNHDIAIENLQAADSTLRDADFAAELAELTRQQVLFQSGISVLGQAQALPRTVLQLLAPQ